MAIGFSTMLSWLPGAFLAFPHVTMSEFVASPHLLEMGGAGCVTCFAGIWGIMKCRSSRSNSNDSRDLTQPSVSTESGPTSAMYSPPPDPMTFSNNSDYASAFARWNQAEMHRINLCNFFDQISSFFANFESISRVFEQILMKFCRNFTGLKNASQNFGEISNFDELGVRGLPKKLK